MFPNEKDELGRSKGTCIRIAMEGTALVLSGQAILKRLRQGEIFRGCTWEEDCIKEASYALRVADDGLLLDGEFYDPGDHFSGNYIEIKPGEIAILSTMEVLNIPDDLVGKIGIRLNYAMRGLTGLMGIQVDPSYGQYRDNERLFIRVANFGNEKISLSPGTAVFTFELHEVTGKIPEGTTNKKPTWERLKEELSTQSNLSWSYVTRVNQTSRDEVNRVEAKLREETQKIRDYLQPVVLFGIFLVAVTILGVSVTLILNIARSSDLEEANWVTDWAWVLLLVTLSIATVATAAMGVLTAWRLWKHQ